MLSFWNYGTLFKNIKGVLTSVFEQVVTGFDTDNTIFLMKCNKEGMLEGMILLLVGMSLLLKKCGKDGMLEGKLLLPLGMSLLLMNRGNVMANNKVMAPVGTSMTYRKA